MWEVIYVHFYNCDRPLDLAPVLYELIELIIETSFWTKDYSTFDIHTQHTRLLFNECLFHLCDCIWSSVMCILNCLLIKSKNIFEYFISFWKSFYAFVFWVFVQIAFFIFFIKNSFNHKKLATKLFLWKWVKAKYENTKFRQKLLRLFCYCFASKVFPRKVLCFRGVFHE